MRAVPALHYIDGHFLTVKTARIKHDSLIKHCADHWRNYTERRRTAREIIERRGKPHLMYNRIEYNRYLRSPAANEVIRRYVGSIRIRVRCRKILLRNLLSYARMAEHEHLV